MDGLEMLDGMPRWMWSIKEYAVQWYRSTIALEIGVAWDEKEKEDGKVFRHYIIHDTRDKAMANRSSEHSGDRNLGNLEDFYNYESMSVFTQMGGCLVLWLILSDGSFKELLDDTEEIKAFMQIAVDSIRNRAKNRAEKDTKTES